MESLWFVLLLYLITVPADLAQNTTDSAQTDKITEQMTSDSPTAQTNTTTPAATNKATVKPITQPKSTAMPTTMLPPTTPDPCPSGCTCSKTTRTAECSVIADGIVPIFPSYITTLILNNRRLPTIQKDAFTGLSDLIRLYLISCEIDTIEPGAFNGLTHLKILHLRFNNLASLSADGADGTQSIFLGLNELKELDLRNNDLNNLQETDFQPLGDLQTLNLDDNDIQQLPDALFQKNSDLNTLTLKSMRLTEIPSTALATASNLEYLELSSNNVDSIPANAFASVPKLKQLILTDMSIERIDDNAFSGLGELTVLDLLSNNLESFNKEILQNLPSLTTLILSANPWNCGCEMYDLIDFIKATSIDYYSSPWLCVTPNRLNGRPVYLIQQDEFACQPIITSTSQSKEVEYNQQSYFECVANGDPKPDIRWLGPDGQEIMATSNIQNVYTTLGNTVIIIRQAKQEESGTFTCIASNSKGEDRKQFSLLVQNIPTSKPPTTAPAPTSRSFTCPDVAIIDVKATEVRDTSAKLAWMEFNHPMATGYVIETTKFASQDGSPKNVLVQPASNTTYTVPDLDPGTGYVICVSVIIDRCPTQTPYEQCKQLNTQGAIDSVAQLKSKHTNEIIGTALSVFFGTLLILASIFVILWQYRKPRDVTKYDLQTQNRDTTRFTDVENAIEIDEDDDVTNSRYVARTPSARYEPGQTNAGADFDDENSNSHSTFKADVEVHGHNGIKPQANGIHETSFNSKPEKGLTDIKEEPHYDKVPDDIDDDVEINDDTLHMSRLSTVGLVDTRF